MGVLLPMRRGSFCILSNRETTEDVAFVQGWVGASTVLSPVNAVTRSCFDDRKCSLHRAPTPTPVVQRVLICFVNHV